MRKAGTQRINIRCCYGTVNNTIVGARSHIATTTSLLHGNITKHKIAVLTLHARARNS